MAARRFLPLLGLSHAHFRPGGLMRSGLATLAIVLVGRLGGILMGIALARLLGPSHYGVYVYAVSILTLIAFLPRLGLPVLLLREVGAARASGDADGMGAALGFTAAWVLAVAGILSVGLWVLGPGLFADAGTLDPRAFWIGLPLILVMPLVSLSSRHLQGLGRAAYSQMGETLTRYAVLVSGLVIIAVWSGGALVTAPQAMALNVLAFTASLGLMLGFSAVFTPKAAWRAAFNPALVRERSAGWLTTALFFSGLTGLGALSAEAMILVVGHYLPPEEVSTFRVATHAAMLAVFGLRTFELIATPRYAALHRAGDLEGLQRLSTLSARLGLALCVPIVLLFFVFGREALGLIFGDAYRGAYPCLMILISGYAVNTLTGPVIALLNMAGQERVTFRVQTASTLAQVSLAIALTPVLGLVGTAAAVALTEACSKLYLHGQVRKHLGIDGSVLAMRPF